MGKSRYARTKTAGESVGPSRYGKRSVPRGRGRAMLKGKGYERDTGTRHYCESVWAVNPVEACAGHPVALLRRWKRLSRRVNSKIIRVT